MEPQTSSLSTLDLALRWTLNCHERHLECRQLRTKEAWRPTRLINIGTKGDTKWKLDLLPDKLQHTPVYMTLSYRWGLNANLQLLTTNINSFQEGRPIDDLPSTFRDAISIAQRFAVRFLWIDALCIVQDSRADWEREATTMGRVYANALCNIAAASSDSPDGGLFRTRDPEELRPGLVRAVVDSNEPPKTYYVFDDAYASRQLFSSALLQRGWVFQERLLCPRVLYFTEEQVFWECFVEQKCEAFPYGIPGSVSSKKRDMSNIIYSTQGHDAMSQQGCSISPQGLKTWNNLVQEYSRCEFTKTSDKLFALAGLASIFCDWSRDEYIAGLWKSNLAIQLCYSVWETKLKHPSEHRAPSWSWASLDEHIQFPGSLERATAHISILAANSRQSLTIRGHLSQATFEPKTQHLDGNVVLSINGRHVNACINPDTVDIKTQEVGMLTILTLLSYPTAERGAENPIEVECLVLEPVLTTATETYRRIGILNTYMREGLASLGVCIQKDNSGTLKDVTLSDVNLI
ncbi:tol protein, partial [Metarhizium majus ARSEF 297]